MFNQVFDLLPNVIDDWVDSSDIVGMLGAAFGNAVIPTVLAAAADDARSGAYYGPGALMESLGPVGEASISRRARNEKVAAALWQRSEELVDHSWQFA